jgi:hypothetical protein
VSTILIDRRTAALLGRLAAEPTGGSPVRAPSSAPPAVRRRAPRPVGRASDGGARLRRRLHCEAAAVRPAPATARAGGRRRVRARPSAARAARPALHLTRRGRLAALLLLLLVLSVAFSMGRVTSTALGGPNGGGAEVVVQRGDSLFSIAERTHPDADPRSVVADLMAVNGLAGPSLQVGQHLRLP